MNPPVAFSLCINSACKMAEACLRYRAYREMSGPHRASITIVHPDDATGDEHCARYYDAAPVRIAYGMKSALAALPHGNVAAARSELIALFGERTFYKKRNGERALSPDEQEAVTEILVRYGAEAPLQFDRCTEDYLW